MDHFNAFFAQKLSVKSANYIKHLRVERKLDFIKVYKVASNTYKELKAVESFDKNSEAAIGHSLCTAAMEFLEDFKNVDDWF